MPNPLFETLGKGAGVPLPSVAPTSGPFAMIQRFNQFCSMFRGDPKQEVQRLLQTGQMSQDQYSQLQGMAQSFMQMLRK